MKDEKDQDLRAREETGRQLLNAFSDGALLIDPHGVILAANETVVKSFGASGKDINGGCLYDLLPVEVAGVAREHIEKAVLSGAQERYEERHAGIVRSVGVFPLFNGRGEVERVAVFSRDITKERNVDRMKTEFVSIASHELRTPLGNIMESVSQVVDGLYGEISQEQKMVLGIAHRNCTRMARLIHDLLDISRIESGKIVLTRRLVDVGTKILNVLDVFKAPAKQKGLELRYEADSRLPMAYIDADRMDQVLVNLIGNAIKFTPSGGTITVEAGLEGGFIRCVVSNTGAGIAPEDLDSIFDKFVTLSSAANGGDSGTGLGLPIALQLVRLHGGDLWAESEPGWGNRFIFRIPDYQSEAALLENLAERIARAEVGHTGISLLGIRPKEWSEIRTQRGAGAPLFLQKLRD
ncbi:MAG: PAS domain-containing sensor histidine kinase, partial [bacterium]